MSKETHRILKNLRIADNRKTVLGTSAQVDYDYIKNALVDVLSTRITSGEDML
jgi:hypothetical protein